MNAPPPSQRFVAHDGCQLAYRVKGDGPPMLFVQGVGVHGDGWRPQVDDLARSFRCVTFDNRGVGASQPLRGALTVPRMADDARAVLDAANCESAHVVGHSLGGLVALQLALDHPRRVRSLALLCTFANGARAGSSWRMAWIGARTRIGTRRMRRRAFLEILHAPAFLAANDRDALARSFEPLFGHDLAVTPPVTMPQLRAMRRTNVTARLGEVAAPTLVVSGAHDPIAPTALGAAIANGVRGARFVVMPDAAHGVPIAFAATTNAALREHAVAADAR